MNQQMKYDPMYGMIAPDLGWVPAPRYLLRRDIVLSLMSRLPRGRVLEIGCGAGALLCDLRRLGFDCAALELSKSAQATARQASPEIADQIRSSPDPAWSEAFDYVLTFEVLEHIRDDRSALIQWSGFLKEGGRLVLSVPADPWRWNASDVWAGHFRRYTRESLHSTLLEGGLGVEHIQRYGFPLANLVEPLRTLKYSVALNKNPAFVDQRPEDRSLHSGVERSVETRLFPIMRTPLGRALILASCFVQRVFSRMELGNGLIAIAANKTRTGQCSDS